MLFDLKNSIRKAKGKSELDIEQARDEVASVHTLTFHHPLCGCQEKAPNPTKAG
jgi:hypothetical protein